MKTHSFAATLIVLLQVLPLETVLQAQGTVSFNYPWADGGLSYPSLYYDSSSISFGIGNRTPPFEGMIHVGAFDPTGYPHNGTPYLSFVNTLGTPQFVVFAWTNAASLGHSFSNGAPFGLTSVDLADPVAPSLSPVSITFNGFREDNSMITQSFTVGGGSSSAFQTFLFGQDFASGLVRVEIPSGAWAMDNLVFIPEPGSCALLGLGLLVFCACGRLRCRRAQTPTVTVR